MKVREGPSISSMSWSSNTGLLEVTENLWHNSWGNFISKISQTQIFLESLAYLGSIYIKFPCKEINNKDEEDITFLLSLFPVTIYSKVTRISISIAVALNRNYGLHTKGSIVEDNVGWEFSRSSSDQNPLRDSLRLSPLWGFGSSCP